MTDLDGERDNKLETMDLDGGCDDELDTTDLDGGARQDDEPWDDIGRDNELRMTELWTELDKLLNIRQAKLELQI